MDHATEIHRLALKPSELAKYVGVSRSRIFQAIRDGELVAHKAGSRTTIIEIDEGRRWIRSLPTAGVMEVDDLHAKSM